MAPAPTAFLCHSSADKKGIAERLASDLRGKGVDLWLDKWEIAPGDSLRRKIDTGIERAQFFLALLSPNSLKSEWVQTELDAALVQRITGKCRLIPILFEVEDKQVPPTLAATRWIRLHGDESYEDGLRELIGVCHGATEKPPLGAPPKWTTSSSALTNTGLSVHAQRLASILNERCEKGLEMEFFFDAEEIRTELELSHREVIVVVGELEDAGIIGKPQLDMNAGEFQGISSIAPAAGLFFQTDPHLRGWNPAEDAYALATVLSNEKNGASSLEFLAQRLGWEARRVNPAAYYLNLYGYAKGVRTHDDTWAFGLMMSTPRTMRLAAQG